MSYEASRTQIKAKSQSGSLKQYMQAAIFLDLYNEPSTKVIEVPMIFLFGRTELILLMSYKLTEKLSGPIGKH